MTGEGLAGVDMSHLQTASDVAVERLKLMSYRDHMEEVEGGYGFRTWRVFAGLVESAITFRAVELGLEGHGDVGGVA